MFELHGVVGRLAAAIADGEPVSWQHVEGLAKSQRDHSVLKQLHAIAWVENRTRANQPLMETGVRTVTPVLWRLLLVMASLQVALAILGTLFITGIAGSLVQFQFAICSAFAAASVMLAWGSADSRAHRLGHVYLLIAAAFSGSLISAANAQVPTWWLTALSRGPYPEAFIPSALWLFVRDFPRTKRFTSFDRFSGIIVAASVAAGIFLFVDSFVMAWRSSPFPGELGRWLWEFRRADRGAAFWNTVLVFLLPAIIASNWRVRISAEDERRRTRWFFTAMAIGILPVLAAGPLGTLGSASQPMTSGRPLSGLVDVLALTALLSLPFTTAYAVLVRRVLPIRVMIHGAIRHALARYTLVTLTAAPVVLAVGFAYVNRDRRIDELLQDPLTRFFGVITLLGAVLLVLRGRLLAILAGYFAGEPLDQTKTLVRITEAISNGRTAREVAFITAQQLEEALDVSRVVVAIRGADDFTTLHGILPLLPTESALLALLHDVPTIDLSNDGRMFELLPQADREWLLRGRFHVLARIPAAHREVAGIVGIGARRREVPFSKNDLGFITTVATTAGLALHRPWVPDRKGVEVSGDEAVGGLECSVCGSMAPTGCRCRAPQRPALLPPLLAGKFTVLRRLGQGGMGVVYLGKDVRLGRDVALKTLPQVSGGRAEAMLDEAKAMAHVEHPNLALIYDVEAWRGTPVLVVEYLAGGTLTQQLMEGPLPVARGLELGAALADGLAALHEVGILHRDIKPSNIGLTRSRVPKLLDFGIARLLAHAGGDKPEISMTDPEMAGVSTAIAGTPLYLSPEAMNGARPDVLVDLWSLSVVVLEAITGLHPFRGRTHVEMLTRIRMRRSAGWSQYRDVLPSQVLSLFERALHQDIRLRPQTARTLADEFRVMAAKVA